MNKLSLDRYDLYQCPVCEFVKKKNILSSCLEKARYDQHVCDSGYLKYMNNVYDKIKAYLNDGISLDYGCGQIHALSDILELLDVKVTRGKNTLEIDRIYRYMFLSH